MKIIQTFWSKPFLKQESEVGMQQSCGWCNPIHYYMSHALSCLSLRKQYECVELYTDREGKRLLIDELKLPYTAVHMLPDELEHYPTEMWALGKVFVYLQQKEPFLHVDNDVYIWKPFSDNIAQAPLVAQNYECGIAFNHAHVMDVMEKAVGVPGYMRRMVKTDEANVGIIGGTDTAFLRRYAQEALRFADSNVETLGKLKHPYYFNTIFEQYLLTCLAESEGRKITYAFHDVDDHFSQMVQFEKVPDPQWYVHTCGPWKKVAWVGEAVAYHLHQMAPEMYRHIQSWYESVHPATSVSLSDSPVASPLSPRLSVIIPARNAELFIGRCLRTLCSQTYRSWEAIVVDDGSDDCTEEVVCTMALHDARIKVIRQEKRGVSAARNRGLADSRGELVTFVDSDDYMHPQYFELMIEALDKYPHADMSITCSVRTTAFDDDAMKRAYDRLVAAEGDGNILRCALFLGYRKLSFEQFHTCHGKVFRRQLFVNLAFPEEYAMYEDALMMHRVFSRVEKCVQVGHRLYFWVKHPWSALASSNQARLQGMSAYLRCLDEIPARDREIRAACLRRIFLYSAWIRSLCDGGLYKDTDAANIKAAVSIPGRAVMEFLLSPAIPLNKKWSLFLCQHSRWARQRLSARQ